MIGRVETEVERGGRMFGQAVRGHWRIENRLHGVLDVVFREDLARLGSGKIRRTCHCQACRP
jgi:predicted transposase YbfD/YdcC